MKYNKGFIGIGVIIAIIAALAVGGGVVYYATKTPAPSSNTEENNYQPQANQNQQQTNTQTPPVTTRPVASITVLSPSAGERVSAGSSFLIKWNSANISNRVLLTLHLSSIQQVIAPDSGADITVSNNGSFTWKVPRSFDELNSTPVDRDYIAYITIQDAQNKNIIAQSKNFTITPSAVISAGHIEAFEKAVNKADFTNASKYFADKVYVVLEGSSCCGEVSASRARQELEKINGLVFTFNSNDSVVKEYMASVASDYPNRRLMKNSPKLYFDEYIIGVESDVSQNNKAAIGYKVSNGKITDLFINKGRDR